MMDTGSSVRRLYEAYQARDWEAAGAFLHPDAVLDMPNTAERLVGRDAIIAFQREYPEPWGILKVEGVLAVAESAAAEVSVVQASGRRFCLAAFWRSDEALLHMGVEYWVTVGGEEPPASRSQSPATKAARQAWREAHT